MAGSIKTEPVTKEYEAGWDAVDWKQDIYEPTPRAEPAQSEAPVWLPQVLGAQRPQAALVHEDTDALMDAVGGDTDVEVEVGRENARTESFYDCPSCGWHLKNSSDRCGNATCRMSRRR